MAEPDPIIAVAGADMSADRQRFTLRCKTIAGRDVTLAIAAAGLDQAIDALQSLERMASTLDPMKPQQPGEPVQIRTEIVARVQHGTAEINGAPHLVLAVQVRNGPVRYLALDAGAQQQAAEALASAPTASLRRN